MSEPNGGSGKAIVLHAAVIAALFALNFVLPDYHHGVLARVMVLAVFAMGYNLLFGYAGLLSLGHAMFFAAGLYGAGLTMYHLGWGVPAAFVAGLAAGALLALVIGVLALRTSGVAFMIVTMMFAQVAYLLILYFGAWTRGDEGLVIQQQARAVDARRHAARPHRSDDALHGGAGPLRDRAPHHARHRPLALGRVLVAIRENEERTQDARLRHLRQQARSRWSPPARSARPRAPPMSSCSAMSARRFASVQYSILPLLWVLLGGAATTLGPLVGTLFMYYVVDITSGYTSAYMLIVGVALILLVLFFPKGMLGTIRDRWARWLP